MRISVLTLLGAEYWYKHLSNPDRDNESDDFGVGYLMYWQGLPLKTVVLKSSYKWYD
jgi:hypothetical protein